MTTSDKEDLIYGWLDGDLSPESFQTLQDLLKTDAETKALYVDLALLDHGLSEVMGEGIYSIAANKHRLTSRKLERSQINLAWSVAAACLIIGSIAAWYIRTEQAPATTSIRFCANSVWSTSGAGPSPEEGSLSHGQIISIEIGTVELKVPDRATAIIEGPAELILVNDMELRIDKGRGSFVILDKGVGFTVVTPKMRVVDVGTEFGVVSDWGPLDEVHVFKGAVNVSAPKTRAVPQSLKKGQAVSVDEIGAVRAIPCETQLYQRALPAEITLLAEDGFEIEESLDNMVLPGDIPGWKRIGATGRAGRFNPEGKGRFYDQLQMDDNGKTNGICPGMRGPCVAYFYGARNGGLERRTGSIRADSVYTATFHLGVRGIDVPYAGFTISFMSENTVLHTISSSTPPGEKNSFKAVTMSWHSENLPDGVAVGDPLSIRIGPLTGASSSSYLDFDNFQLSVATRGK